MKNNQVAKLRLFAQSLVNRYEEEQAFFVALTVELTSGTKKFQAKYEQQLYYNKEYLPMTFAEAVEYLIAQAPTYDAMVLTYEERGQRTVITANDRDVTIKQSTMEQPTIEAAKVGALAPSKAREAYIKASRAGALLTEIGILSKDGKIKNDKIRKYNQIDHFIEVVDPILQGLPKDKPIRVLDAACGKSYLTFVLNYYIKDVLKRRCHFIGVDYSAGVIASSKERAERLGYKNMTFVEADLNTYEPDDAVDLLVSLHACDNATDFAIAAGVRLGAAAMVLVPCCHKEFLDQIQQEDMEPLFKHGIFKARFNDMLTDASRALYLESRGYEVSALEYISPLDTPKNIMLRAVKVSDGNDKARQEYKRIKQMFHIDPILEKL